MEQFLFMCGGSGASSLEGLIYALSGDVFVPENTLHIIALDTDQGSDQWKKTVSLVDSYITLHQRSGDSAPKHLFSANVDFSFFPQDVGEKTCLSDFLNENEEKDLCRCLMGEGEMDSPLRRGFHGCAPAAEIYYSKMLQGNDNILSKHLRQIHSLLEKGEKVQTVVCGSAVGATGSVLLTLLPSAIRSAATPGNKPTTDIVCTLPHYFHPDEEKALRTFRQIYSQNADHIYAVGMPAHMRSKSASSPGICDFVSSLFVISTLSAPDNPEKCHIFSLPDGSPKWNNLGIMARDCRRGFGGMYKTALLMLRWIIPATRSDGKPGKKSGKSEGWFNAYFKDSLYAKEHLEEDAGKAETLFSSFLDYVINLQKSLPSSIRFSGEMEKAEEIFRSNYREMLEKWGQLAEMRQEAKLSGMSDENVVHRYDMENNEAEQFREDISALQGETVDLTAKHSAWRRQIGGQAAADIIRQLKDEYGAEIARLKGEEETALSRIEKAEKIVSDNERYKVAAARSKLSFLQSHIHQLESSFKKAAMDITSMENDGTAYIPPEIGADKTDDDLGDNSMLDLGIISLWKKVEETRDEKERYQLISSLWDAWSGCVCSLDGAVWEKSMSAGQVLSIIARDKPQSPSLTALMSRIMELLCVENKE